MATKKSGKSRKTNESTLWIVVVVVLAFLLIWSLISNITRVDVGTVQSDLARLQAQLTAQAQVTVTPVVTETSAPTLAAPATLAPTQAPAQPSNFLLAGSRFPAYANGQLNTSYDLYAEANGRLWQKWLPTTKVSHSVAFELPPGDYIFNGVVARLYLDVNRNGLGSSNPLTVGNGNDLKFTVKLPEGADYKTAWVLVESDGGTPAGFDIWFQGE